MHEEKLTTTEDDRKTEDKKKSELLQSLFQFDRQDRETSAGLDKYTGLRPQSFTDYKSFDTRQYKSIKEELALLDLLPAAPTLGEYSFLFPPRTRNVIKELFESQWTAGNLSYAAIADVFTSIARLTQDGNIPEDDPILKEVRTALLTASNLQARAIETYKYLAIKQTSRTTSRDKPTLISSEEASQLNKRLDVANKLRHKTFGPSTRSRRGRGRTRGRGAPRRGGRYQPWRQFQPAHPSTKKDETKN